MLGNLDNSVIFKKAFTDKFVFKAFVRDILGIDIEVDTIETEKQFEPKVGYVDFKLDIFAESIDKRVVIEIQRVEYDHNFDRFLHYFLMVIAEQQKKASAYGITQTVYMIVVLTAPYKIDEKNGKPVRDEVLLLKLNPKTLLGEERDLYGHQFICLNPNHPDKDTPPQIRDWLDLIYQSIHSPERPILSETNEGVKRAAHLINFDNLTPEERAEMKNNTGRKIVLAQMRDEVRKEVKEELQTEIRKEVKDELETEIRKEVKEELQTEIRKEVKEELQTEIKLESQMEIARAMKADGEPIDKIVRYTGLSSAAIEAL